VNCGNGASLDPGINNFAVSVWIKVSSPHVGIIIDRLLSGNPGYTLLTQDTGKIALEMRDSIGGYSMYSSNSNDYQNNSWHHIVMVFFHANSIVFYKDGIIDGSPNISIHTGSLSVSKALEIGCRVQQYYFHGYLDDVRIYNRALSAGEIQYLYTKTQGRYK